ncbi:hypothetical protein M501DRAFT_1019584 [Patellaria atrata CBS 101060]|uniref:Uncharacterized protein n=1 Tax=Patellaria atrata CBS 101060 TaxID=1346257 RepID=A0A9P4VJS4_9PEZI|nr:hypothetical protein M501DRAFT_1019584 [Patellaria atrata CBS 101060]
MAPRRGGSSGGGRISVDNKCDDVGAFQDGHEIAVLVIYIFFMIYVFVVFFQWLKARKANDAAHSILRWYGFGLAIMFLNLGAILGLIFLILFRCTVMNYMEYLHGSIAVVIFRSLAEWLILFTIMSPMLNRLQVHVGRTSKLALYLSWASLSIIGILLVVYLIIRSYVASDWDNHVNGYWYISVAYQFLFFLCVIFITTNFAIIMSRMASRNMQLGSLKFWLPFLLVNLFIYSFISVFDAFYYTVADHDVTQTASVVFVALYSIFQCLILTSLLKSATSPALTTTASGATYGAVKQNQAPQMQQWENTSYQPQVPRQTQQTSWHGLGRQFAPA